MGKIIKKVVKKLRGGETFTFYMVKGKRFNTKAEALRDIREGRI